MISNDPYEQFNKEELILRDLLATDRTELTNETTFLSYVRTTFALFLAGLSVLNFFKSELGLYGGIFLIICSCIILAVGYSRYRSVQKRLSKIKNKAKEIITDSNGVNQHESKSVLRFVYNMLHVH